MHSGKTDNHFMHECRKSCIEHEGDEPAHRHVVIHAAAKSDQNGDQGKTDGTDADRAADLFIFMFRHFNAVLGGMCLFRGCAFVVRVILFAAHQEDDLNQCDQTGAGHDAVRNVERIDVNAKDRAAVAAQEKADAQHAECPDIADKGCTQSGRRELEEGS